MQTRWSRLSRPRLFTWIGVLAFVFLGLWLLWDDGAGTARSRMGVIEQIEDRIDYVIRTARQRLTWNQPRTPLKKTSATAKNTSAKPAGELVQITVTDVRKRPIADAKILLKPVTGKTESGKTNSKGQGEIRAPAGLYTLGVSHPSYTPFLREQFSVARSQTSLFAVTLQIGLTVTGKVLDEENKPVTTAQVTGSRVWLESFRQSGGVYLDDASLGTMPVDGEGSFTLTDASIGQNSIVSWAPGYSESTLSLTLKAGVKLPAQKLVLKRPASIAGKIVDENLEPVHGATIKAVRYSAGGQNSVDLDPAKFSTKSTSGTFELRKLFNDGVYSLVADHPGFATVVVNQVAANTGDLTIQFERGGAITGQAVMVDRATTGAVLRLAAQTVLQGTTITRIIQTRADGQFEFTQLPYASYRLSSADAAFATEPKPAISVAKNRDATGTLVEIYQASPVEGRAVDVGTDESVGHAGVTLRSTYGVGKPRMRTFTTTADATGIFRFDKVPGGLHRLEGRAEGYLPVQLSQEESAINLDPGERLQDALVLLSRGGKVSGYVTDTSGGPIPEAEVQLYPASLTPPGFKTSAMKMTADSSGYFEIGGFPVSEKFELYASAIKPGYSRAASPIIHLTPSLAQATTRIELDSGGMVVGRVVNESNQPVNGMLMRFDSRAFPGDPSSRPVETRSDSNGRYLFQQCSAGQARIMATDSRYITENRTVTVASGKTATANFKMRTAIPLAGTVADYSGRPIADAQIRVSPEEKSVGYGTARTNSKGYFEVRGLGGGTFRVEATFSIGNDAEKQTYTFIVPSAQSGNVTLPIDCDLAPELSAIVAGDESKRVSNFTIRLRSRLDTDPQQYFRFNLDRTYKNSRGLLKINKIPRGLYRLEITADGYEDYTEDITIGPGLRTVLPRINLKPAGDISGKVVADDSGKSIYQATVRVLDDAKPESITVNRIELANYKSSDIIERIDPAFDDDLQFDPDPMRRPFARVRGNVIDTILTDYHGKFSIDGLPPGSFSLEISHPDYQNVYIARTSVMRDRSKDLGEIPMQRGGTLAGRLSDENGTSIYNASIEIPGERAGRNRARTDTAGNFRIRGLAPGSHVMQIRALVGGRNQFTYRRFEIVAGRVTDQNIVLMANATVDARVAPRGHSGSGAVRMYPLDHTDTTVDDAAIQGTLRNGRIAIPRLLPGRYFVCATGGARNGPYALWRTIDVVAGEQMVLFNQGEAKVAGQMQRTDTQSPAGTRIRFIPTIYDAVLTQPLLDLLHVTIAANATGKFSANYLQAGTYQIASNAGLPAFQVVNSVVVGHGMEISDFGLSAP